MSQVINGTKLSNGNYMIELTALQMDDLETRYISAYLKWKAEASQQENVNDAEVHYIIADEYYKKLQAIRAIQGK
jgi:hypothetical protein